MPRRPPITALVVAALALLPLACSDDEPGADPTTTTAPATTTTAAAADEDLDRLLLEATDLPPGFTASDEVDDTITSFCVGEDATAGLQASARAARGFAREGGGASVIQLAFRFRDGGAAAFVEQAEGALTRCHEVPTDASGLAFAYESLAPEVAAALGGLADEAAARYGVSAGSGELTLDVAVVRVEDVGMLVAVLGLDQPRAELDALAATVFAAVAERAQAGAG
jgi:hypothetical protein